MFPHTGSVTAASHVLHLYCRAVPYKEFFKHSDGDLCLVMAYCEGGDLFRYVKQLRWAQGGSRGQHSARSRGQCTHAAPHPWIPSVEPTRAGL